MNSEKAVVGLGNWWILYSKIMGGLGKVQDNAEEYSTVCLVRVQCSFVFNVQHIAVFVTEGTVVQHNALHCSA